MAHPNHQHKVGYPVPVQVKTNMINQLCDNKYKVNQIVHTKNCIRKENTGVNDKTMTDNTLCVRWAFVLCINSI